MKAVIMAGGQGTRLRPLTCDLPKPMVPIVNLPVMEHIINLLKRQGITEIGVTTYYMPGAIKDYFASGEKWGVNLHYFVEETPLGTAGSVHNGAHFLDETFVVISGDAITDFNLKEGLAFHQEKEAEATIILAKEEYPLDYGVVMTDEEGRIIRFLEKPNWGQVFSDTINTGIYILEPSIFELYAKGVKYDFSQDLFPLMLKEKKKLYGKALEGYWNDIGSLEEYHETQFNLLNGSVDLPIQACAILDNNIYVEDGVEIDDTAIIEGPLYIGEGTRIEQEVFLKNSVIGKNNIIQPYTSVKNSIIWDNNYIGPNTELRGTVLTNNIILGERVAIFDRTAVGKKVSIGRESRVSPEVKIWPEKEIASETEVKSSIVWAPKWSRHLFSNNGVIGQSNIDITPEFVSHIAVAYGSTLKKNEEVIVSCDNYGISDTLKRSLISGLQSAGINVLDIGEVTTAIARYSIAELGAQGGVHIRVSYNEPQNVVIEFLNEQGVNISIDEQKGIEKKFFAEDYNRASLQEIGEYSYAPEMTKSYLNDLLHYLDKEIIKRNYFSLVLDYEYNNLQNILAVFLQRLNCQLLSTKNYSKEKLPLSLTDRIKVRENVARIIEENNADFGLIIDHNAENLNLVRKNSQVIPQTQYWVLISYILLEKGLKKLYLPLNSAGVIETMAEKYGAKVEYTPINPQIPMNKYYKEEENSLKYYPYRDGIAGLGLILEKMAKDDLDLEQLIAKIPDFYLNNTEIPCDWKDKGRVMRHLTEEAGKEAELIDGVKFNHPRGWALIIPDGEKAVFHIYAEGEDLETAESLTGFYEEKVKKLINKGDRNESSG